MGLLTPTSRPRAHLSRRVALLALLASLCPSLAVFGEMSSGEYALKAAFIYNFSKFVEWPEGAFRGKSELCIASLGRSPLDRELAALNGKGAAGRTVVFREIDTPQEAAQCQVLFISRPELARLEAILDAVRDLPILTIADRDDFCKRGGMLSLEKESGKIVFDVNYAELKRARLKPHSQMLKLARKIHGRP